MHHLDRIHDDQFGAVLFRSPRDFLDIGFREHLEFVDRQTKSFGAHADLLQGFLARDIQGFHLLRQPAHDLQQQGTFACTGVAADQNHGARHQAASKYAIKFPHTCREAGLLVEIDGAKCLHCTHGASITLALELLRGRRCLCRAKADAGQGIPGAAGHTLALPLCVFGAAVIADKGGFGFCHGK